MCIITIYYNFKQNLQIKVLQLDLLKVFLFIHTINCIWLRLGFTL